MIARFVLAATLELLDVQTRLEEESPGRGDHFQQIVRDAVRSIEEVPRRWPLQTTVLSRREIRFVTLRPFPYLLLYEVRPIALDVLAISHFHRRPGYWIEPKV